MEKSVAITDDTVVNKIYHIRGKKVVMDRYLAEMYGVETRVLNHAVKRNERRFPSDFMFQLTERELDAWKSQIVTSNKEKMGLRKLPKVFTEQGVAILSSVLNSDTAIDVNIQIIRIFTRLREALLSQQELADKLNVKRAYISKIERAISDMRLSTLKKVVEEGLGGRLHISIEL